MPTVLPLHLIKPEMHSLDVIKNACADALERAAQDEKWQAEFCSVVDPQTVSEMARRLERWERVISEEELQALGKLVRDLAGYIKLTAGDKPDPIREDLLLQARQLLGLAGI